MSAAGTFRLVTEVSAAALELISLTTVEGAFAKRFMEFGVTSNGSLIRISPDDMSLDIINNQGKVTRSMKLDLSKIILPTAGEPFRNPKYKHFTIADDGTLYAPISWMSNRDTVNNGIVVFDKDGKYKRVLDMKDLVVGALSVSSDRIYVSGAIYGKTNDHRVHELDMDGNVVKRHLPYPSSYSWIQKYQESLQSKVSKGKNKGEFLHISRKNRDSNYEIRTRRNKNTTTNLKNARNYEEKETHYNIEIPPSKELVNNFGLPVGGSVNIYKTVTLSDNKSIAQVHRSEYYVDPKQKKQVATTRSFIDIFNVDGSQSERIILNNDFGILVGADKKDILYFVSVDRGPGHNELGKNIYLRKMILKQ
ncbi:MAG: hypothetical protein ACC657_13760 [Thiohalomonadales bacterium]